MFVYIFPSFITPTIYLSLISRCSVYFYLFYLYIYLFFIYWLFHAEVYIFIYLFLSFVQVRFSGEKCSNMALSVANFHDGNNLSRREIKRFFFSLSPILPSPSPPFSLFIYTYILLTFKFIKLFYIFFYIRSIKTEKLLRFISNF